MGCQYENPNDDQELKTSGNEDLILNKLPENDEIEPISFPSELKHAIRNKLSKVSIIPVKFFEISDEEFNFILNRNNYAKNIIKLYSTKIDEIEYEFDVQYKDIGPIKILDPEGGIQYYKGGFNKEGKCQGKGIWIKDYNIYIGNFRNDEFYGIGLFITEQGDYYFGQWKNSQCNGFGSIMMENKFIYQGDFKNSKKEGYGEERYPNGDMYKGNFYEGKKNGRGQYIFLDGSRYDGNFKNSKYNGYGQITLENGHLIRGNFKNGKLNGEANFNWSDGSKFLGNFIDDKKIGEGIYVWKDGKSFKGKWDNDLISGPGMMKEPNRRTQESIIL